MVKHNSVVIISLLTVLAFITGCPPAERESIDSQTTDSLKIKSHEIEPNVFEPAQVEPNEVEPVEAEPNEVVPVEIEPDEIESTKAEPNETEPAKAEPNELEPAGTEPNEIKTVKVESPPKVTFHDKCAYILTTFVDDKGMVDYRRLKQKRLKLKQLLGEFAELDPGEYKSWPKDDKIAFWINAYNLHVLNIIIENYPIESYRWLHVLPGWEPDSIQHINKRIGGIDKQKFIVMDEVFTLQEIEQRFFREEFNEPRVFFA